MASVCKVCDGKTVEKFISFGKIPLGNAFLSKDRFEDEESFDLDLGFCTGCKLVQQITPPPMESLAKDYTNYAYVPFGNILTSNLTNLGKSIVRELGLNKDSLFVDLGSNDGTMLAAVKDECRVLGIEPAVKISQMGRDRGVNTITTFFTPEVADNIIKTYGYADVATTTQVLQHISDIKQFVKDVYRILKPDGTFVVEGRYFTDTVKKRSYDTVYNEMLYFFTLTSLVNLMRYFGMTLYKAEMLDVYGGSLRIYAKKSDVEVEKSVKDILEVEKGLGIDSLDTYVSFANDVFKLKAELSKLVSQLRNDGKKIAGYGAPSTSATLLNFCGISNNDISYVVDDSPLKQGLYTPGTHIPIVSSSMLEKEKPDYVLLLAWRLKEEILPKIEKYKAHVILPLPHISIIN